MEECVRESVDKARRGEAPSPPPSLDFPHQNDVNFYMNPPGEEDVRASDLAQCQYSAEEIRAAAGRAGYAPEDLVEGSGSREDREDGDEGDEGDDEEGGEGPGTANVEQAPDQADTHDEM